MIRNEAVAGQFYPGTKNSLLREIESLIDSRAARSDAVGVVSPHAGYAYSGSVAGSVLSHVSMKDDYIIMGPNHTGLGEPFSIDTSDAWKTPMGDIALNGVLREALLSSSRIFRADRLAHLHEHSIEVQLPFLQVLAGLQVRADSRRIDGYRRTAPGGDRYRQDCEVAGPFG